MFNHKRALFGTGLLSVAVAAGACATTSSAGAASVSSNDVGPVAGSAVSTSVPAGTVLSVADNGGYLETLLKASGEGSNFPFKVKFANFIGGPPMLQAFEAGSVDIGFVATTPEIFAQAAGQKIVAAAAWDTAVSTVSLVTAPGQNVSGWKALKGKKVAYQSGTVEESVLLEGLKSAGLDLKDITSVNLSTTSITPALENGSVSAAVLLQPFTGSYLAQEPTAKQVVLGNELTDRADFLIASTSAVSNKAKQPAIAYFIGRLVKAYKWVNSHPDQWAKAYYVADYKIPLSQAEKVVSTIGKTTFLQLPGGLEAPQQTLADLFAAAGQIPKKINVKTEFSTVFNTVVAKDWKG